MAKKLIQVGDTVCYSKLFLKSIGEPATSSIWRARGRVTELKPFGDGQLASLEWDQGGLPGRVLTFNLALIGSRRANEAVHPETGQEIVF